LKYLEIPAFSRLAGQAPQHAKTQLYFCASPKTGKGQIMGDQRGPKPDRAKPPSWWDRLDRLMIFNPERWPHRELLSRAVALIIVLAFLALRICQFDRFPQSFQSAHHFYAGIRSAAGRPVYSDGRIAVIWGIKLAMWLIETTIYLGYIAAYASRAKAVKIATGIMQTAFPVIVAALPLLIALMPSSLPRWVPYSSARHVYVYLGITMLIVTGGLINLIGLLTLRRAFTIMSEARELVMHGIYRYIRHPLYTGHFIMFLGSLLMRLHPVSIGLYLLFCIGQVIRATIEEHKLAGAFSEYADYRGRTGMFFPKL
jgi:protein-S-isoprenylcysteine O-methyltransferase Ste14